MAYCALQQALVTVCEALEQAIEASRNSTPMQAVVRVQLGREHRYQCQRHQARETDGRSQGDAEFAEYQPDVAGHERDRKDNGDEYQRRRDDSESDFATAIRRRQQRGLTALDPAHDVLQDDDGIVDDEPDREHESEQRERVDRKVQRRHHRERGDDGYGNCQRRDDRGPHRPDERVDDDQDQQNRKRQRLADLHE